MTTKLHGTVKWFRDDKGFGFIECEGKDYFVHYKAIKKDGYKRLLTGEKVCFLAVESTKGLQADEVECIAN